MTARARLIRGLGAQSYGRLVMMGGQILAVPLLVSCWGAAGYGEWITLTALASYITYANVGVPGAVRADLALAYGEGGHDRMRQSFQSCLLLVGVLGLVITGGFLGLVNLAPLSWIARNGPIAPEDASLIASALAIQVGMSLLVGVLQAALSAIGRYGYTTFVESNRQAAEFVGLVVLVGILHKPPIIAAMIYPASMAVHLAVLIGAVQRDVPWVLAGSWRLDMPTMRRLTRPMMGVLATSFGYYSLSFQAPRVILGALIGPTAVAVYSVTAMLMRIVRMPIDVVAHSPTVELSLAHGAGEPAQARALLQGTMRTCFWIAIALIPGVLIFGPTVVDVWTRHRIHVPLSLLLITSVSTAIFSLALPGQEALMSLGQLGRATFWLAALSPPMLALQWFMTKAFGLEGAALAVVALDLVYAGLALHWSIRLFGFERASFVAALGRPPLEIISREAAHLKSALQRRYAS